MRTLSYFGLIRNVTDWRERKLVRSTRALIVWPQEVCMVVACGVL